MGEDNVIGFYVHLDELNPHVHCTVIPVDERNKISFNKISEEISMTSKSVCSHSTTSLPKSMGSGD